MASPSQPYAELHCHSTFSFLRGASQPERLIAEAARLDLQALAITDHDGFYGVVRFAAAARTHGVRTVIGAELSLPEGHHLLVLARGRRGYGRLAAAISEAHLRGGTRGKPQYDLEELSATLRDQVLILTGCREGAVPAALLGSGPPAAAGELDRLVALFGGDNVAVELTDHGEPTDDDRNQALAELAAAARLPTVATNNVHYAVPGRGRLAAALAAVRA
ncbi:MAG: PHP domain-containing protein, partial [Dactylosporangium sp.]|nr:PHP domain-containing protein [Dactylosporangium sp.]